MGEDCVTSVGAKILEYLVKPVLITPLRPIFWFKSIVNDFHTVKNNLFEKKGRVENAIDEARDRVHEMDQRVHTWLECAIQIMEDAQILQNKLEERRSCCFNGAAVVERNRSHFCSLGWTCRYQLSKQVGEHTDIMKKHCETLDESRDLVSRPIPLLQHIELPQDFVSSESVSSALHAITEVLVDDRVNRIGVYSEAGAGKTTLAWLVFKVAQIFDIPNPIIVTVHQNQESRMMIREIQGTIADFLSLTLEQEGEEGRASKLRSRLGNGQKILIILDDVLEQLDLARVGIPSSGACKVILTTNDREVCVSMHTEREVELGTLSEDEAWGLFKRIAEVEDQLRTNDVIKKVVSFCNGIPKALVTVGGALRGVEPSSWEDRFQQLKKDLVKEIVDLQKEHEKLSLRKENVQNEVLMATNNAEVIEKEVEAWLADAERVMKDTEELINKLDQNNSYSIELYRMISKKALEQINIVENLCEGGKFDRVGHPATIRPHVGLSSEDFIVSKSAESTFNKIMDALKRDDVNKVGLYGMGGIGKTTLAKQVQKEAKSSGIFDRAILITLSQTFELRRIQGVIADFLNLKLEQETEEGRESKLNQRLERENILIILDDVWEKFDLAKIGIFGGEFKGCKILLTTRRLHVCTSMSCQINIASELLSDDEAWDFFKKKSALPEGSELNGVAKEIVGECKGLPIALATVGLALRKKSDDDWIEALDKLRSSRLVEIPNVDRNTYKCMQLSYDYLKDSAEQAQFLFLLCSLFPEDHEIEVEDLTRCVFAMGLFKRVRTVEDARRKVRVTVRNLKDSGLLLGTNEEKCVKMHDVVRDVALWIGGTDCSDWSMVAVRDGTDLSELNKNGSLRDCRAISFMANSLSELSNYDQLVCPKLETMLIFGGAKDIELPDTFFKYMGALKILDVRYHIEGNFSVPQSLQHLRDLQMLNLGCCRCYNGQVIGELSKLKVLSISCSRVDCDLEAILMKMKELRLLYLSCEFYGHQLPSNIIKYMSKLEELYTYEETSNNDERSNVWKWLYDINSLQNLVKLEAHIDKATCLPVDFCFPNMEWYCIVVGPGEYRSITLYGRMVLLCNLNEMSQLNAVKKLFPKAELLYFKDLNLGEDVKYIFATEQFPQDLKELYVERCGNLDALFDFGVNQGSYVPRPLLLQRLGLCSLPELKQISKGSTRFVNLCNLKICNCPKLKSIFSSEVCIASSLQQLKVISIARCDDLEEVFCVGDSDGGFAPCFKNLRKLQVKSCSKLKAIHPMKPHPLFHFPKLEKICLVDNAELELVFGRYQTFCEADQYSPSLRELVVEDCPKLPIHSFTNTLGAPSTAKLQREDGNDQVLTFELQELSLANVQDLKCIWNGTRQTICFSYLTEVYVGNCNNLKQLFTVAIASSLKQLQRLRVYDCIALQQIIAVGDQNEEGKENVSDGHIDKRNTNFITVPNLEHLSLDNLPSLTRFLPPTYHLVLPCLQGMVVRSICPKLFVHFVATVLQAPSTTKQLFCVHFNNKEILLQREGENNRLMMFHLQEMELDDLEEFCSSTKNNICFFYLTKLSISDCNSLKQLFTTAIASSLAQLEELHVERCSELELIIGVNDHIQEEEGNVYGDKHMDQSNSISLTFPKLGSIILKDLASLVQFCPTTCHLESPCLLVLEVSGCPKLFPQFFANILQPSSIAKMLRMINLQNLKGVEEVMHLQREDKNDQLLAFHLEQLILANLDDLKCIWSGTKQNMCFSHLTEIHVMDCNKLKQLFTISVASTLTELKELRVERCNELQEIIFVGDQRHEVAENVGGDDRENFIFLTFPKLERLKLDGLPSLVRFFPARYCVVVPRMTSNGLHMEGCPEMKPFKI